MIKSIIHLNYDAMELIDYSIDSSAPLNITITLSYHKSPYHTIKDFRILQLTPIDL